MTLCITCSEEVQEKIQSVRPASGFKKCWRCGKKSFMCYLVEFGAGLDVSDENWYYKTNPHPHPPLTKGRDEVGSEES